MNILVVDDDQLVAISLKTILETDPDIRVIATGHSGKEAVVLYQQHQPDLLLMDIRMNEGNGIEAAREILRSDPHGKILFLTTFSDDEYIIEALHLGAKGYLLKQDFESILPSIHAIMSGQNVYGQEITTKLPHLLSSKENFSWDSYQILPKEAELIQKVAEGLSNKEIAEELYLSEGTVRNYLSTILDKLELRDRTQLAIFYYKHLH